MDYYVIIVLLTLVWSTSHVVKGSLKSKSDGSFDYTNVRNFCSTCKVTRKLSNYTAKKNSRLTLRCAFRGIQPRNITWFKNGKRLKATRNIGISHWTTQNGSRLRIRKATSKDEGRYSCVGRNPRDQYILTTGYVKIIRADNIYVKRQPTTVPSVPAKQRNGKCELYKGKICSPYIQDNVLIYVENAPEKSQEFIETKLVFGFQHMEKNLTKSCRPSTLPLWCHYHFPRCSLVNSKAEPRSICKSECNVIQTQYCKAEYEWTRKSSLQRSEDDLFPDCKTLPVEDPLQSKCVSIKRHVTSLRPGPPGKPASGQCQQYSGDVCESKRGKKVFVKDGMKILDIEKVIKETLKMQNYVSKQCQSFVQPLLCQLRLPDCDSSSSTPKAKPICQDECLVLKNRFCKKEYLDVNKFSATSIFFDCNSVASLTSASGKCSPIGVPKEFLGTHNITIPKRPVIGRCQPYKGTICKEFLDKKNIFLEVGNLESNIERKLKIAMSNIKTFHISPKCEPFVLPLMCHHLFPYCESNSQPKPSYICRQDCNRIRFDFCPTEYILAEQEALTGNILFPRCQDLSVSNERCTSLRRHFIKNQTEPIPGDCFRYKGGEYKGFTNTTESGTPCQRWDETPGASYPELNVEHNFCRNPGGKRKKPWCFAMEKGGIQMCNVPKCDSYDATLNGSGKDYLGTLNKTSMGNSCQAWHKHERKHNWVHNYCRNPKGSKRERPWCYVGKDKWEYCDVPKVAARKFPNAGGHLSNLLYTVIPCVVFGLVVAIVIIAVCWKQHKQGPDVIKNNTRMTVTVLLPEIRTIPAENILLPKFLGNGKFGSMYMGEIYSEDGNRVSRFVEVALKESSEELINQAKRWSQFHHPNLLTIDAITSGSEPMTLVYEPAGHGNLYQYLIYHSPNNPNFTKDHALLGKANLLDISRQIAAGMAYLSSHGYVHEELMTRNCQVAHSMVIKITDFTIDRDVCYYRRPDKRPIALGWMAPETLQTETYTVYSDVWAFGILLWEIFTYGFQPYFGFTFPEVREKILNMVLLEQPRDCIPEIYDLMKTCWKKNPTHRPQFADLHEDLNNLCDEFLDDEQNEPHYVTALNI